MKRYVWLVAAVVIAVMGVLVGKMLRLSYPTTITLAAVPAFLVLFPWVKYLNPKLRFGAWLLAAAVSTIAAWAIYLGVLRFGG
jgi:hypothetical protein